MAREFPDEVYAAIKLGVQRGEIAATIYRAITSDDADTLAAYGLPGPVSISKRTVEQRAAQYRRELPAVEPTPAGEETQTVEAVLRRALAFAQETIKHLTKEPDRSAKNASAVREWSKTAADIGRYFDKAKASPASTRHQEAGRARGTRADTPSALTRTMERMEKEQARRAGEDLGPASAPPHSADSVGREAALSDQDASDESSRSESGEGSTVSAPRTHPLMPDDDQVPADEPLDLSGIGVPAAQLE